MYIQTADMGGIVVSEKIDAQAEKHQLTKKQSIRDEHGKCKKHRELKKSTDFSKMSYWQKVSHCTIL